MTKKEFNELVTKIGLDAAVIKLKGNRKNFNISFKDKKQHKTKALQYKKRKTSKRLKKLNHVNFDDLIKDLNKNGSSKKTKLKHIGKFLNKHCPKSEQWFKSLYMNHFVSSMDDFNKPFKSKYIPDVSNLAFKYVIEIDGSIHLEPEQIEKDKKKSKFYKDSGYTVIRVKAYCTKSYIEAIKQLFILRHKKRLPTPDFFKFVKENNIDITSLNMI